MIDFQFYIKKYAYLIGIVVFAIWMLFFDSNSWLSHRKLNKEIEVLKRQKEFLQKEIVRDRDIIREINTAEGREKFGRENYYFKKENEDIFIIEYDTINRNGEMYILTVNITDSFNTNFKTLTQRIVVKEISNNNYEISFQLN